MSRPVQLYAAYSRLDDHAAIREVQARAKGDIQQEAIASNDRLLASWARRELAPMILDEVERIECGLTRTAAPV